MIAVVLASANGFDGLNSSFIALLSLNLFDKPQIPTKFEKSLVKIDFFL